MKISELYKTNKKSLSFEIFPPKKDSALKDIDETLAVLCELNPDFISVTFGAGGSSNRNRTIELATKIKREYHVEPVVHLTCLHYTCLIIVSSCPQMSVVFLAVFRMSVKYHQSTFIKKCVDENLIAY